MQSDLFSEQELKTIKERVEANDGDLKQLCRDLGLSSIALLEMAIVLIYKTHNYTEEGLGRLNMRKYLIARRNRFLENTWACNDEVQKAREDYDKGLVELTTGVDGIYSLLYAIPRVTKDTRVPYFTEPKGDYYV